MYNEYTIILKKVAETIESLRHTNKYKFDVCEIADTIHVILDFQSCMLEIDVENSDTCKPYRYVGILIVAMVKNEAQTIYTWYDNKETNVDVILYEIYKSLDFASKYKC